MLCRARFQRTSCSETLGRSVSGCQASTKNDRFRFTASVTETIRQNLMMIKHQRTRECFRSKNPCIFGIIGSAGHSRRRCDKNGCHSVVSGITTRKQIPQGNIQTRLLLCLTNGTGFNRFSPAQKSPWYRPSYNSGASEGIRQTKVSISSPEFLI